MAGGQFKNPIDGAETVPHPGVPAPDGKACRAPHRGHQPQLFLVAPLGLQQLPGGAGAFPLPAGTLLLQRAPSCGARALHVWLTDRHFPPQPAGDSNPNRFGGGAAERSAPPGAERLLSGRSMRGGRPLCFWSPPILHRPNARVVRGALRVRARWGRWAALLSVALSWAATWNLSQDT